LARHRSCAQGAAPGGAGHEEVTLSTTPHPSAPAASRPSAAQRLALKQHARRMRHSPTASEWQLWQLLKGKQLGVAFRRQVPVGGKCPSAASTSSTSSHRQSASSSKSMAAITPSVSAPMLAAIGGCSRQVTRCCGCLIRSCCSSQSWPCSRLSRRSGCSGRLAHTRWRLASPAGGTQAATSY
jgi:hypothetical protein